MNRIYLACSMVAVLAGCGVRLGDSVDLTFDWSPLTGPSDRLHMPYVAGSDFRLYTVGAKREDTVGWTIHSDTSSVLRVDATSDGGADVTATGAGTALVTIEDERGRPRHSAEVDVRQANRAELLAHGPLILHRPELQEDWDEIRVLAGGSATFQVEWYEGDERLYGHGALSADAEGDIEVEPRRTFLFEDREWVTFTPRTVGTYDVTLRANGVAVRTVRIVAVGADVVDRVELYGMDESRARDGDRLAVLAQAYDAEGRSVFGVEYAWELDGVGQAGLGDLYRYDYARGRVRMLGASFGASENQVEIQAESGFVDSTNRLGCAVGWRGRAAQAPLVVAMALFGLTLARRRRRRD